MSDQEKLLSGKEAAEAADDILKSMSVAALKLTDKYPQHFIDQVLFAVIGSDILTAGGPQMLEDNIERIRYASEKRMEAMDAGEQGFIGWADQANWVVTN